MTNNKEAKIEEIAQELTEIHVNIEQSDESHKRYYEILKTALSEAIDWGAERERGRIKEIILENSHEVYSGSSGFLQTNTDKVMLALSTPQDNKEE